MILISRVVCRGVAESYLPRLRAHRERVLAASLVRYDRLELIRPDVRRHIARRTVHRS